MDNSKAVAVEYIKENTYGGSLSADCVDDKRVYRALVKLLGQPVASGPRSEMTCWHLSDADFTVGQEP